MIESLKEVSPTFEFALNSANIQRLTERNEMKWA
jgi:hypothetical protein